MTYERKHNEANGENNRDGTGDDRARELRRRGAEPTTRAIIAARARQRRNLIATLMLSQGVPMLLGGDERGRTQRGNNNAYCQANEISWYDWSADAARRALTVVHPLRDRACTCAHAVLRRTRVLRRRRRPARHRVVRRAGASR